MPPRATGKIVLNLIHLGFVRHLNAVAAGMGKELFCQHPDELLLPGDEHLLQTADIFEGLAPGQLT